MSTSGELPKELRADFPLNVHPLAARRQTYNDEFAAAKRIAERRPTALIYRRELGVDLGWPMTEEQRRTRDRIAERMSESQVYRARVLGEFPSDKHDGGAVDPSMTWDGPKQPGEFVLPINLPINLPPGPSQTAGPGREVRATEVRRHNETSVWIDWACSCGAMGGFKRDLGDHHQHVVSVHCYCGSCGAGNWVNIP